jgi:hypothetical protein
MKNIALQFDDELMEALNKYRILMGWTWKRMFLYGLAATIDKNGGNDNLMLLIAETLEKRR